MSQYTLLGKTVTFSAAEDNYYKLQAFYSKQLSAASNAYEKWYADQGGAANVINNVEAYFKDCVKKRILDPLYPTLSDEFSIFGVGQKEHWESCANIKALYPILNRAVEVYNDIQECMEEEIAEREENDEWRRAGQISFGVGDTLKNAASNAAHGVAVSAGNAASRARADERKRELYQQIKEPLWTALSDSLNISLTNHMAFVNERAPHSVEADFDKERSAAFLDNASGAKLSEEKRKELLVEAFRSCPWNKNIYTRIFKQYENERKNLIDIAKHYHINLTQEIDDVFRALYTPAAKKSEKMAVEVKAQILSIMAEWGVAGSVVVDEIEKDCLARLVIDLKNAPEERCNQMKTAVEKYDAQVKNKKEFLQKITARIEEIWAKEDGEIFDNYLMNANLLSAKETKECAKMVKERGRTDSAKKYLTAFQACENVDNIKKARKYHKLNNGTGWISYIKYGGYGLATVGVLLMLLVGCSETMTEAAATTTSWLSVLLIVAGVIYHKYIGKLKKAWEDITVNGAVINPIITMSDAEFEQLSFDETKALINEHMAKEAQQNPSTETDSEEKE